MASQLKKRRGVTAGQAPRNSSIVGGVTAGRVGHNSSKTKARFILLTPTSRRQSAAHILTHTNI